MAGAPSPRRVFLTGGTGYLGSRLVPLLLRRGHRVRGLTLESSRNKLPAGGEPVLGNPLESRTFTDLMRGCDTVVQLVGVPKPAPWKGAQFRAIDRVLGPASIEAATHAGVSHFVYVSVAHPAPIMKDYITVQTDCETALRETGLRATVLRPWYILGPGHWWPVALFPLYRFMERIPSTKATAQRLGLVTIQQVLNALVWAVEHPPDRVRVIDVPEIRGLGAGSQ